RCRPEGLSRHLRQGNATERPFTNADSRRVIRVFRLQMSMDKKSGGLAGVVAGRTAISTVGKEGIGLTYRGYSINDLAEKATFEEVAFLLLYGHLPDRSELDAYRKNLSSLRDLPEPLRKVLEQLPPKTHPMDVLRTGCSALGCLEPEAGPNDQIRAAN